MSTEVVSLGVDPDCSINCSIFFDAQDTPETLNSDDLDRDSNPPFLPISSIPNEEYLNFREQSVGLAPHPEPSVSVLNSILEPIFAEPLYSEIPFGEAASNDFMMIESLALDFPTISPLL